MNNRKKIKVAKLSIISNISLVLLKAITGLLSGSVSIISEAIHSSMDLIASIIAYVSVKISSKPADENYPYGYGKVENISGIVEALLIFIAAFWIIYEAINRLLKPEETIYIGWGVVVMLLSAVLNFFVSKRLYKVAKLTGSIALEADALHLKTDVYTSLGTALGLFLMWVFNIPIIDSFVAICVATFILIEAALILKKAFFPLIDKSWNNEDMLKLLEILNIMNISSKNIRTRYVGNCRFIEFSIAIDSLLTVETSHTICDNIEQRIMDLFPDCFITIHVETN